ncbi:nectin-1-like [Pristis pectinata]|uniref:nectin-1-like n=1 Tax=Pristis pectinata TaxID=685728 RepID=UPI00223C9855|nr:nectin-1-like [Pristis pectinata]
MSRLCSVLFQLSFFAVLGAQIVKVEDFVTGIAGDEVRLPCYFIHYTRNLTLVQVTWLKKSRIGNVNLAVYNPQFGTSYPNGSDRFSLINVTAPNCTLTINPLQLSDEGLYNCEVNTFPNGKQESQTNLTVLVKPLTEVVMVRADAVSSEVPVANCTAANGKPAADITWSDRIPGNVTFTRIANADGTVTVLSQYKIIPTSKDDGKKVACLVSHKAFTDVMNLTVTFSVRYPPEVTITGYDGNWYVKSSRHSLECLSKANPPVTSYHWTMSTGPLPPTVQVKRNRLFITYVDYSLNGTWVCEATNAIGKGRGEVAIVVQELDSRIAGESFASTLVYITVGTLVVVLLIAVSLTMVVKKTKRRIPDTKEEVNSCPRKDNDFVVFATLNLKVSENSHSSRKEDHNPETTVHADISID